MPITDAQKAFWRRVNEQGGIGGYEIDVTTYVKDNKYNPQVHNQVYQEIKPNILALAQTLGSPTTAAILPDLKASNSSRCRPRGLRCGPSRMSWSSPERTTASSR